MEAVRERVQHEAPGVYSKDLIEQIFKQPYCKIQFGTCQWARGRPVRSTCGSWSAWACCTGQKISREVYFINQPLFDLLTR